MTDETAALLEGAIAITAALEAESRPLHRVWIDREVRFERPAARVRHLAEVAGVPIELTTRAAIDALAQGTSHGGVIARVGERRFVGMESLFSAETPFVVMLDGIEDPYNFGGALRAFYAAGAHGLIVRPRNWMSAAGVVARASAGASEYMLTAVAAHAEDAAAAARAHGVRVAVADKERATPLYDADLTGGWLLFIGGEKRGVTRSFADAADLRLSIPYGRAYPHALGTVAASAVIAFEVLRQRRR
jgi:23S rRNA (guanosine2251-2'-O)-methyltransferase